MGDPSHEYEQSEKVEDDNENEEEPNLVSRRQAFTFPTVTVVGWGV